MMHFDELGSGEYKITLGQSKAPVGAISKVGGGYYMFLPSGATFWGASMLRSIAKKLDELNHENTKN